jgi:carboxyl-terminal processing protease
MVRRIAMSTALGLLVTLAWAQDAHPATVPAKYSEAFEAVWKDINQNFYDPSFLGVNWADTGARYRTQLAHVHDDDEFTKLIDRMLRELPTSHLHFRVSVGSKTMTPSTKIGVLVHKVEGEDVAVNVESTSDAAVKGIRPGDVFLTSKEGLRGAWGSSASVEVKHCNQQIEGLSIVREPFGWPFDRPSIQWKIIARSTDARFGYLRITHFENDVAPLTDQAMQEMADTKGIIVDIRNNTGGNASYVRLMSYLAPTPRMAFVLLSRPFLDRFGRAPDKLDDALLAQIPKVTGAYTTEAIINAFRKNRGGAAFYTEDVGKNVYKGKIVLLVNSETASAAEGLVWNMKGWPGVTVVGQDTAGAIAGAEDFNIPGGWTLTLPTHAAWGADGKIFRDQKTAPDVVIPETRESLCRGDDAVMDAAIGVLLK